MAYKLMLKELRERRGFTQDELAGLLGIKLSTYRTWEQGVSGIKLDRAILLCDALGCTPNDLCGWWDDHPRTPASDFADERQGAMNRAFEALSDDGKTAALGAVSGIQVAERSREALQGDGSAEPQGVRADTRRTA